MLTSISRLSRFSRFAAFTRWWKVTFLHFICSPFVHTFIFTIVAWFSWLSWLSRLVGFPRFSWFLGPLLFLRLRLEKVILKHSYINCFTLASLLFRRLIYKYWSNLNILDGFLPLLMPVPPRRWHTRGGAPKISSPEAWFKMSIVFSLSFLSQPHLIPQRVEKHTETSMSSTLVKKLDGAHVSPLWSPSQLDSITGPHNLRSFLAAKSTKNYFLIVHMLSPG